MKRSLFLLFSFLMLTFVWTGCDDEKTYSELLSDEEDAIRSFLKSKEVSTVLPKDTVFADSTIFYALPKGVYMRVIHQDNEVMAKPGAYVYIRYKRTNLLTNVTLNMNWNTPITYVYFIYKNPAMTGMGEGIEIPLAYVGKNSEIELLVPSKVGGVADASAVTPVLYRLKYTLIENPVK